MIKENKSKEVNGMAGAGIIKKKGGETTKTICGNYLF